MKKQLKEARELVSLIWDEYNKINNSEGTVGYTYHDDLRTQADCSNQEYDDMEVYVEEKDKECVEHCLDNLRKTLTYCKAVIALQKAEANLPPSVFG
tara:strand:+ start:827 stop:1117 length:291 start_codon:yes stop_codon:yes gene_type:complete